MFGHRFGALTAPLSTVVALLACLMSFSGCGGLAEGDSRSVGFEEAVGYTSSGWNRLLHDHEDGLVRCMRQRGFRFWSEADWIFLTLGPHGIFERETPSAEEVYLRQFGYGVAQRVRALKAQVAQVRQPTNEQYANSLPPSRRIAYVHAMLGGNGETGCAELASQDVVTRLNLPEGGALGEAFDDALHEARSSTGYRAWTDAVIGCLESNGVNVENHDLATLERPFLARLLKLAGSDYTVEDGGSIHYDLTATQAAGVGGAELRALARDEMATARVDAACRDQAGDGAQRAVDGATDDLADDFPSETALLRRALSQPSTHG